MSPETMLRSIAQIEASPPPWGAELGWLVSIDRRLIESDVARTGEISMDDYLRWSLHLSALEWAVFIKWKPKNYKFSTPRGAREQYKTIGEVYASVMDLCEQLHSFEPTGAYLNAAQWFRLVVEEIEVGGWSTGNGLAEDLKQLQSQNAQLSRGECPFTREHTRRLIQLGLAEKDRYNGSRVIADLVSHFIRVRKRWTRENRDSSRKNLVDVDGQPAMSRAGKRGPKLLPSIRFQTYQDFRDSESIDI
jgi:hypothetical protein